MLSPRFKQLFSELLSEPSRSRLWISAGSAGLKGGESPFMEDTYTNNPPESFSLVDSFPAESAQKLLAYLREAGIHADLDKRVTGLVDSLEMKLMSLVHLLEREQLRKRRKSRQNGG